MAVAPISFPGIGVSSQMDFSSLAQLPQIYRQAQNEAIRRQTLAELGQGGQIDPQALIRAGMTTGGDMNLASLGFGALNRQQEQARQAELDKYKRERDVIGDKQWQQEFALKQRKLAEGDSGVYGTPIYGVDPETNQVVLGAIAKDGKFRRIDTGGVTMTPGGIKPLDTGAGGFVPFDPRRGVVSGPTVPKTGDISKDYAPSVGPNGAVTATPIPGSPAAQKIEEEKEKETARAETALAGSQGIKQIIGDVRTKVTNAPWYNPAVGPGAGMASNIPGTAATDTAELIKTISANIGFDRLQRMREESPTGGALGAVAVQELESLQKTIASLSQSQSKGQFLANLKRVEDQYDRIIKKASAYPNAPKHGFGTASGALTKEQYDALPPGSVFIAPDGTQRVKP